MPPIGSEPLTQAQVADDGWHTPVIAAIDQGTQSTRVYLFDKSFQPVAFHQVSVKQILPQNGWIEHDPMDIWAGVRECLAMAMKEAEEKLGNTVKVLSIGLTNQRETTVVWHRVTGLPLYNAIVWQDNRTSEIVEDLSRTFGSKDSFRDVTGLPLSTYFSALKFKWMYDNLDQVRQCVDTDMAMFGTIDTWLIYQLTGGGMATDIPAAHVTDVTNASRTMLMDLKTCQWHTPYFNIFSIRPSVLPKICSSAEVYGYVAEGSLKGVPVSGCLGDQMAALLGQRCVAGEAKNTYGTGLFMMLNTGTTPVPSNHGLLTTVGFQLGPDKPVYYALEGAIAVGGMGITWLKDNLGIIENAADVEELAGSVKSSNGVFFVPAFTGLLAPYWEDSARGTILGLTTFTNKAHIARAMLEAICYQTREVIEAMKLDANLGDMTVLRVDGGCTKNDLLMQLQADILQTPVLRPQFQETTALGAALAAGVGAGIWTEEQVFCVHSYNNTEFQPQLDEFDSEKRYGAWKKAVRLSFNQADLRHEPISRANTMSRAGSLAFGGGLSHAASGAFAPLSSRPSQTGNANFGHALPHSGSVPAGPSHFGYALPHPGSVPINLAGPRHGGAAVISTIRPVTFPGASHLPHDTQHVGSPLAHGTTGAAASGQTHAGSPPSGHLHGPPNLGPPRNPTTTQEGTGVHKVGSSDKEKKKKKSGRPDSSELAEFATSDMTPFGSGIMEFVSPFSNTK